MQTQIAAQLAKIEQTENVRILHAVESGSRAWGFASPDSDYDVRFIYVRRPQDYLRLEKVRDVIEWQQDDILDINGWDLPKALRLLRSSNPTLFEWNNSPLVYKTTADWAAIRREFDNYFLIKAGLYHYLSTAISNYRGFCKGRTVRLKKYFYVVRPLLACQWILDKKCPPPMRFSELIEKELAPEMRPIIDELLQVKTKTCEVGEGKPIEPLNTYIEKTIMALQAAIAALPSETKAGWARLNELFWQTAQNNFAQCQDEHGAGE
jgi:predicted nucleotidyltransferase